jgi:hypothetical protein
MTWLKDKIAAAWRWSRTVFLNLAAALAVLAAEFVPVLIGVDWSLLASPARAALIVLALNALNVAMRLVTTGPVGGKP